VFLLGHTVAMVTYCVARVVTTCSPVVGRCFDTVVVASSGGYWLWCPVGIWLLEAVLGRLESMAG